MALRLLRAGPKERFCVCPGETTPWEAAEGQHESIHGGATRHSPIQRMQVRATGCLLPSQVTITVMVLRGGRGVLSATFQILR